MNKTGKLVTYIIAALFLHLPWTHAHADASFVPELQPSPDYLPAEVVGIQMRALASNDQPFDDAGIALTFRFASPSNKVNTGPIEKFTTLFDIPSYRPMLNHSDLEIGDANLQFDKAYVPVTISSPDGTRIGYMFILGKQTAEPFVDCWMTESVIPVELDNEGRPVVM